MSALMKSLQVKTQDGALLHHNVAFQYVYQKTMLAAINIDQMQVEA